jgi:hypothetical protein
MRKGLAILEGLSAQADDLISICRRRRVRKLELFGSAAKGDDDPLTSDLDFLVEFTDLPSGENAEAYFGLLEDLESLFHRPIDLVMTAAITNPYFLENIESTRQVLYAA